MKNILEYPKDAKDVAQDSIEALIRLSRRHEAYTHLFVRTIENLRSARTRLEEVIQALRQPVPKCCTMPPGSGGLS